MQVALSKVSKLHLMREALYDLASLREATILALHLLCAHAGQQTRAQLLRWASASTSLCRSAKQGISCAGPKGVELLEDQP